MKTYRNTINTEASSLIRRCRWLRTAAWGLWSLYLLGILLGWLAPALQAEGAGFSLQLAPAARVLREAGMDALPHRLLGLLVALPATLLYGRAVWSLDRLTRRFAQRDFFSVDAIAALDACAGALFLGSLAALLEGSVFHALLGLSGLAGPVHLKLQLDLEASALWAMLVFAILRLLTVSMADGARLAKENSEFV